MSDQQPQFMKAKITFATELDGAQVTVHRGENVRTGHPLIRGNPQNFEPLTVTTRWDTIEQATAAPGEERQVGRRHKPRGSTGMPADPRGTSDAPDENVTKEIH